MIVELRMKGRGKKKRKKGLHTLFCASTLFCTAVPIHQAAIFLISGSSSFSSSTSGCHRPSFSMLFALSMFSTSCSKLSNATTLSSTETCSDLTAAIDRCIISASDTVSQNRLFNASAATPRGPEGGSLLLLLLLLLSPLLFTLEYCVDHLRRLFRPGSMLGERICAIVFVGFMI